MRYLLKGLIYSFSVFLVGYFLPGIFIASFLTAIWFSVLLGILNIFLRPILGLISLPINVLTLGLFGLIINTLLIMLADSLIDGVRIDGFFYALVFGVLVSVVNQIFQPLTAER